MELIFLGTSAGKPTRERNVSSLVLNLTAEKQGLWLFDCGEATQHQMLRAHLNPQKIEKIFISHLHGDHIFGLPGLLTSRSMSTGASPLVVYGPKGIQAYVESALFWSQSFMTYPLTFVELSEGILLDDDFACVKVGRLSHRVESFGFRIEQKARAGALNVAKLRQAGIPPGPLYAQLKQGIPLTLPDDQILTPEEYLLPGEPGKVVVIFGDTEPCEPALALAHQADILVHETTLEASLLEKARQHGHSTTHDAAQFAAQAQVKKLIITHFSSRYLIRDNARLLSECRSLFAHTEVATDFARFSV